MARKKKAADNKAAVLFDVVYEDGTLSSNRKVPAEILGGLDGDEPARAAIEAQDEQITTASGKPRKPIARLVRSGAKPPAK